MAKAVRKAKESAKTQIIGFRLPLALAREVKAEAGRRGMKLNELLAELWAEYRHRRRDKD